MERQRKNPAKATKSSAKAAKSTAKPISGKNALKTKPKAASQWLYHAPVDISLENRPVMRPILPGERQLDYSVQVSHADLPQGNLLQISLHLRAVVSLPEGPCLLAEIHYLGVAEIPNRRDEITQLQEVLYSEARAAMMKTLQLAGHEPPLPAALSEVKLNQNK